MFMLCCFHDHYHEKDSEIGRCTVKAWLADKDAEALKCQKQLVEEEEMARKRQAEILEKKRQKKLRQKEQKAREQRNKAEAKIKGNIDNTMKALSPAEASLDTYNLEAHSPNTFVDNATFQYPDTNEEIDGSADSGYNFVTDQNIEKQSERGHNHQHVAVSRHQGQSKSPRAVSSDFDTNQNSPISKLQVIQKYGTHHDQKASANGSKVWSRKPKTEIDKAISNMIEKESHLLKNQEVLIGSIFVNLGNCSLSEGNEAASIEDYTVENVAKQNNSQDKPMKPDFRGKEIDEDGLDRKRGTSRKGSVEVEERKGLGGSKLKRKGKEISFKARKGSSESKRGRDWRG
ncbi:hypothetical protein RJT34_02089 [Clitoria ternatea]|uniref:Uncharacterized protein n=1 Tax=Clitoria ternatea TaxID=43366 RepID=A0AAN9KKX9_CLITE